MTSLNLVNVRRCPTCGHLVPKSYKTCPYCSNAEVKLPTASSSQPQPTPSEAPRQKKPMSPQAKKKLRNGLIIGGSVVAALVIGLFVWNKVSEARVLKQSILEPLTQQQLEAKRESCPQLLQYRSLFNEIRDKVVGTPEEDTYRSITYEQMIDYLDYINDEKEAQKLQSEARTAYADYNKEYETKFGTLSQEWTEFYKKHDPSAYIQLTFHTNYERDDDSYYTMYHPAFWVDIAYPNGAIEDCEVYFGLWSEENEQWNYGTTNTWQLERLKNCTRSNSTYWTYVSSDEPDIYDRYTIKYEVKSVTLRDGSFISLTDVQNIPSEMLRYLEDSTQENKDAAIKALVDSEYETEEEYVASYIDKSYEKKDELCYKLLAIVNEDDQ